MAQNDIPNRFYNQAADTMRAAQLGQLDYTPDQLRVELNNIVTKQIPQWSAFDSPFIPDTPDVDVIKRLIDEFVDAYQDWLDAGKPALGPWPKESAQ
jgi:hypothetical protein